MLEINFYSDSDAKDFDDAVREYEQIWAEEGERIVEVWEKVTGLAFAESTINAVIFRGVSHSHPLSLRDNLPPDRKKSVLVHELGHRLLYGRRKEIPKDGLENHKHLDLALYDVLCELYGEDFAQETIEWDSNLRDEYREAWEWALSFNKEERAAELRKVLKES